MMWRSLTQRLLILFTAPRILTSTTVDTQGNCTTSESPWEPLPGRGRLDLGQEILVDRKDPVLWGGREQEGPLSEEQLDDFETKGFVIIPGLVSGELLEQALEASAKVAADYGPQKIVEPGTDDVVKTVYRAHMLDDRLRRVTLHPFVVGAAQQILAEHVYVHHSRINYQRAFVGKGFNWHSDVETWHSEDGMRRMRALSAVVMLEDNFECNGALMVIPGSHKTFVGVGGATPEGNWQTSLSHQAVGSPSHVQLTELARRARAHSGDTAGGGGGGLTHCTGAAGSLLIFDCNLMHGSHSNISPWNRTTTFTVFNAVSNRLIDPIDGTPPRPDYLASRGNEDQWTSMELRSKA
eukprot:TRINITY_DN38190_c1_g1_i1.p1 TRINITY_DN38190_c1_g1~~TRINITY_DN38190_c1_g1_i1.p1  ORF type:complete len:352 (-),score=29.03 TRINITY_DN38190_c1_g1_i1:31-1086(-)